ncbi:hypothetical protein [Alteromonas sp. RKMC-009]|uniref:hypothetical protein n=1 Tax=Alteromonas sp. RKMC-009 TaxID=2267264 RepID=UPI000E678EBE|nr:hypothetical protein [Alteromonas sp. RKMC-009]AYA64776.1 hypothetical protein DS731_12590 [Alteromonas sp. RKMC-009]
MSFKIPEVLNWSLTNHSYDLMDYLDKPQIIYPDLWRKFTSQNPLTEKFWRLAEAFVTTGNFVHPNFGWKLFLQQIEIGYTGLDHWSQKTPDERNSHLNELATLSKTLAKKIAVTPLNHETLKLFNHEVYYAEAARRQNTKLLEAELPHDRKIETLGFHAPTLEHFLSDLAELLKSYSEREHVSVSKVNADDSNVTYFVRSISDFLVTTGEKPRHELVALSAGIAFDLDFDTENVRTKLKRYSRSDRLQENEKYNKLIFQAYNPVT